MEIIFLFVVLFVSGTKANPDKTEKIKKLEKELSTELKAAVFRRLNALAEAGQKFPKKKAFEILRAISLKEAQKQRRKIIALAELLRDPKNPKAPRKVNFDLRSSDVRAAFLAIVRQEDEEVGVRAAMVIDDQLVLASRDAAAVLNSMLNTS